jgi:PAS domain S-box-containing protein
MPHKRTLFVQLRRIRPYGEMAILAGVYLAAAWVSLGLDFEVNNVTAVWPPTGIALAALLLRGPALWPGIVVGSFLANWLTGVPILASAGVGVGDALECLAGFWLLRRVGFRNSLDHSRDVGALLLAAIVCAPLSATVGTASMLSGGAIAAADAPSRWLTWCFGDAAGVILVAPLVLTWFCRPRPLRGAAGRGEMAALLATLAVVVIVVFGRSYPFPYPIFPVLVWAALRGGTRTTASASLVISAASVFFLDRALPGTATMGGSIYHLLAFDALAGATALMLAAAVVEREAARGEEKSALNLLEAFFSGLADRVFVKDLAGRYLMVNPVAARIFGAAAVDLVGRADLEVLAPEAWPAARAADRAVVATGQARTLEERIPVASGGEQIFLTTLGPFRDASGRIAGVIAISRDITERQHMEDRVRESEEKYRSLIESSSDYICTFDEEGRFLFLNRGAPGFDADKMIGTTVYEYSYPEHHETIRRAMAEVFRTGRPGGYEIRGLGVGGAPAWYRCAIAPLMEDGRVKAVMVSSNDITERRNMEEKLRESEGQFRSLVENAPDFIATFEPDGRIRFLNRAAPGHDVSMFVGKSAYDFIPPADHARVRRMMDEVFRTGVAASFETGWGLPGEPPRSFRCRVGPMMKEGSAATALVISTDITESQKAELELRLSREQLQRLSRRLIEAQETERRHIARELHDEIGQALTAVKISLQAAENRSGDSAVLVRLKESASIVDDALDQVRSMSVALRPSLLDDLGLVPALRWYLDQQSARGGFEARFEADPEIEASSEVQTACFRIAQEALTNVSRHAAARRVRLEVRQANGRVGLTVSDDGRGFDVKQVFERYGADASLGLHGMRERARLLGGRVTVQSEPDRGTVVRAEFPSLGAE